MADGKPPMQGSGAARGMGRERRHIRFPSRRVTGPLSKSIRLRGALKTTRGLYMKTGGGAGADGGGDEGRQQGSWTRVSLSLDTTMTLGLPDPGVCGDRGRERLPTDHATSLGCAPGGLELPREQTTALDGAGQQGLSESGGPHPTLIGRRRASGREANWACCGGRRGDFVGSAMSATSSSESMWLTSDRAVPPDQPLTSTLCGCPSAPVRSSPPGVNNLLLLMVKTLQQGCVAQGTPLRQNRPGGPIKAGGILAGRLANGKAGLRQPGG